jgi:tRNA (guanine-N7-)-methyltransferase
LLFLGRADKRAPMTDPTTLNRLYGRAKGHTLRPGQRALVDEMLPKMSLPDGDLSSLRIFGDDRPLHFEIGFGAGEHLAGQAALHPAHGLIGCEPFLNGVVGALLHIRDDNLGNVRLHMGDALGVLRRFPDASLDRIYLLHPDPWPKARHAKRRMMNPGPIDMFAAKLKPGGEFRFGTDHAVYCRWAMMQMNGRQDFEWQISGPADFQTRPDDWPETRYERKARTVYGHEVWYFRYVRR